MIFMLDRLHLPESELLLFIGDERQEDVSIDLMKTRTLKTVLFWLNCFKSEILFPAVFFRK